MNYSSISIVVGENLKIQTLQVNRSEQDHMSYTLLVEDCVSLCVEA